MEEQRFCLIQDEDCHWYICPAQFVEAAEAYFEKVSDYWNEMPDDVDEPEQPEYLQQVGGSPSLVTFTNPIVA